jgi:3-oxoacyl-[acyl-carrier protein] reductase
MLSSVCGLAGKEGQVPYATSKGGLIGLTHWLGDLCAGAGIRVNAVAPGFIDTDMTRTLKTEAVAPMVQSSALRRVGRADEVAEAVHFLLSPGYLQSTTLRLDGGFHR